MLSRPTRDALRPYIPNPVLVARRKALDFQQQMPLLRLKYLPRRSISFAQRSALVQQLRLVDQEITCKHTNGEMERILAVTLRIDPSTDGCIVEAGCYKGGSTAKLSVAAKLLGRKLVAFDSFAGLPENKEKHGTSIFGGRINFRKGAYRGRLEEVKTNVQRLGALDTCEFVPGWFEDTMPQFRQPIAAAFTDVDLASSTRTCLRYLYPLLMPGGSMFSHDGDVPLCIEVFRDDQFWRSVVGYERPPIQGLGRRKLLQITKPRSACQGTGDASVSRPR